MAAAIGADLPINQPVGNMVIDIGGGTTETAVISLGGIVALEAVRVGSFDIDAAIQAHVRKVHGLAIGERTAEEIKISIGSAMPTPEDRDAEVRGRDLVSGLPKVVILTAAEIREAIDDVVKQMVDSVIRCLAVAPPELSQDFLTRGMFLVGGGSMLRGLAQRIERDTKVPVVMSDQPLEAVVLGAGHCIENFQALRGMFMDARK
jgi:rod shape-determining protein MreB